MPSNEPQRGRQSQRGGGSTNQAERNRNQTPPDQRNGGGRQRESPSPAPPYSLHDPQGNPPAYNGNHHRREMDVFDKLMARALEGTSTWGLEARAPMPSNEPQRGRQSQRGGGSTNQAERNRNQTPPDQRNGGGRQSGSPSPAPPYSLHDPQGNPPAYNGHNGNHHRRDVLDKLVARMEEMFNELD
ncbi:hypothetical protein DAEQUDRAFT_735310 [Daedalea quercina L-15889]|uniref:Uncharacterized protein n=1 Tax=Daedalea quercina L-15889 TaxID=1314783 RepID=A0A165TK14_9APHY|nr:hypothetical protein DAEQUDRAFT_735310 [Daedalea quercina L-15889]